MKYSIEIDGLRAIAVLMVLIFHINNSYLPGGFIGVDIFFVISGYLITKIVNQQIENKQFSFIEFYTKRIKRILPLFTAIILFSLLAGYFLLFPTSYRTLGSEVIAADFFVANIRSALKGSYFNAEKIRPLLHLWSLAIEEQFYFMMPAIFLVIRKYWSKQTLINIVVGSIIISLMLSQYMSSQQQYIQYSYYLLPTRAWELLCGSLLALLNLQLNKKRSTISSLLGFILIGLGLFFINKDSTFPGYITVLPVLGNMLLILGQGQGIGKALKWQALVYIGTASYSIYMWHWPVLVFLKSFYQVETLSVLQEIIVISIILIISFWSKKYIEDHFRYQPQIKFKQAFIYYFLIPLLGTSFISLLIYKNEGYQSRFNIDYKYVNTSIVKYADATSGIFLTKNKNNNDKAVLIGDSHAMHFSTLFTHWFDDNKLSLELFTVGGCSFYTEKYSSRECEIMKET